MRTRIRAVLLLTLLAAVGYATWTRLRPRPDGAAARARTDRNRAALLAAGTYDPFGQREKRPARLGEWLWAHPEPGQDFAAFLTKPPLVAAPDAQLVIVPLTPLSAPAEALLEPCRDYTQRFFARACVLAEAQALPESAARPERGQYDASEVLEWLAERRPAGALSYTGLCDRDLFIPALDNFVFGLGRFSSGIGCYSFTRFHPPGVEPTLLLRRALHLLTHELGHSFGLAHCVYFECSMNGANSLDEADRQPLYFCPVCLRKLQHCFGFDLDARYAELEAFYREHALLEDAAWVAAQRAHLGERGRPPWGQE